jgi:hypothetical protein
LVAYISQSLETRDVVRFQGQPVTVSFWYRIPTSFGNQWTASLVWSTAVDTKLTDPGVSYTTAGSLTLTNTTAWTYASFTTFVPTTAQALAVQFVNPTSTVNGAQFQLTGVQLEKGTVATPFEVRPYAVELQLCQRYYQVYGPGNTSGYNRFGAGEAVSSTQAVIVIPFQVTMRAAPSTYSNSAPSTFQLTSGASFPTVTNITTSDGSPTSTQLFATVASGLTAGYGVMCVGNNNTSAFVGFGAEL